MGTSLYIPTGHDWLGARRATSNTGELSAVYHALDWIRKRRKFFDPASSSRYNIVSDSVYCVKLFAIRAIKPVPDKHIVARINVLSSTRCSATILPPSPGLRPTQTNTIP